MDYIVRTDIYIYSFIILAFLLVYFIMNAPPKSPSKKLFIGIILSLMLNIAFAALSCALLGVSAPQAITISKWSRSLLIVFTYLPVAAWLTYVDYRIFNNYISALKHSLLYLAPVFLSIIMVFINIFTGVMFTIDENGQYIRQVGITIAAVFMYSEIIILLYILMRIRSRVNTKLIKTVLLFMLFPIASSVLEYFFYGLKMVWPAFAFSTFMVFLILEKDAMLKDALTKLNTRVALETRVKQKLRRREPFSLIMIDLDGFKQINDQYGHKAGDDALMIVASILEDSVKRTDMVCRFGGDEFLILVESQRANAASYVRDRIRSRISAFNKKKVKPYQLEMSFGLKFYNKSNISAKQLVAEVDRLMYIEKENNKDKNQE